MTTYTYPLQFVDVAIDGENGTTVTSLPLTVGTGFIPGDMRVIYVVQAGPTSLNTVAGWAKPVDQTNSPYGLRVGVYTKVLHSGDVDATLAVAGSGATTWLTYSVTIRNPNAGQALTMTSTSATTGSTSVTSGSVSTPNAGAVFACMFGTGASAISLGTPSGYTSMCSEFNTGSITAAMFAKSTSSGTSGTITSPVTDATTGTTVTATSQASGTIWFSANPDINASIGTATTETDTAASTTASLLNSVSFQIGTAVSEVDTASQMFTPLTGYRISPPLALPQSPITNSIISWTQNTPAAGSTVKVETSVDGGLTWQTPVNNGAVPRLTFGTNFVQTVLTRVTLNRLVKTDASPSVPFLQVSVATNASRDELVPLGTFLITATDIEMVGGGATGGGSGGGGGSGITGSGGGNNGGGGPIVTLTGVDLSREVSRRKWEDIYFIAIGTNYGMAIMEMVDNRLPGLQYNFTSTPETVQSTLIYGDETGTDPWQDAQDLATDIGCQLFFDAAGVCTLRPVPDPATSGSVWEFNDTDNPVIASVTRSLTDESTYNYVIVQGEQSGDLPPVQAIAFDDDPNSITYYLGKYGIKPVTYTSAAITTTAQAQEAANAILLAVKGASETVTLDVSPMPALEPGDVITVTISGVKASGDYLVQEVTTPISAAEAQTFVLYRQTA